MPKVNIDENSKYDAAETFSRVRAVLESDGKLKAIDPNIEVTIDEASRSGTAKGKQFSAQFEVKEASSGSSIHFVVELPFLLAPLKGKVKSTLQEKIAKALS